MMLQSPQTTEITWRDAHSSYTKTMQKPKAIAIRCAAKFAEHFCLEYNWLRFITIS